MSAFLDVFVAVVRTLAGVPRSSGSVKDAIYRVTLAGGTTIIDDEISIAAGATVEVWAWADTSGFEFLQLQVLDGAGYLEVSHRVDPVTSSSDETPNGTGPWNTMAMSCFAPFIMTTDRSYYNATAATQVGDTAGLPSMLASGGSLRGVVSKVAVKNNGTSAVRLSRLVIQ